MAKISNTTVYPTVTPADDDLLILTDATDSNRTKTVKMSGVKSYLNVDTFTATGTITSTQILNSFTQPVILIPGVAGKHIVPISMVLTYVPNTTAYPPANQALFTFGTPSSSSTWGRIITAYLGVVMRTRILFLIVGALIMPQAFILQALEAITFCFLLKLPTLLLATVVIILISCTDL